MKTISKIKGEFLKGKLVFLRSDLNSAVINGNVLISERIKEGAKTIRFLKKRGAKVVVVAHQGKFGKPDHVSLKQHSKLLNKYVKIKFVSDTVGEKAIKEIKNLKPGKALLLENVRFLKDELYPEKKNNRILKLASTMDIYVNDAFSNSHRNHTSMVIPKYLPKIPSYVGLLFEQEIKALKKIKLNKCLYVLGGAKPEDNILLLKPSKRKPSRKNKILSCGLFGQICLIAKGKNLGAQNKYMQKNVSNYKKALNEIKKIIRNKSIKKNLETPVDFAVKIKGRRKELPLEEFPSKYEIFDIGEKTIKRYVTEIKKAKAIFMKGPAGFCTDKNFRKGTKEILNAIANNKGFSIIGGGHLNDAIRECKVSRRKFNHISLSGGALLRYIAGEKLPGLEALKKSSHLTFNPIKN